jgi:acyl-CoA synthetase (AMP-forming)/AMP-acid ligase II
MTIWTSDLPAVVVGDTTLHACVRGAADAHATRTALVDARSGVSVTYGELADRVDRIGAALSARGRGDGGVLALWAPNMPAWGGVALGAMAAGLAVTPVSVASTERELRAQLIETSASILVTIPSLVDTARAAAATTAVKEIVVIGRCDGLASVHDWLASPRREFRPAGDPCDLALLPFSSGTTGAPKAVCLSHANMVTVVRQLQARLRLQPGDVVLAVAPFFHILGVTALLSAPLAAGATVVCVSRFDPAQVLDVIDRYRVTVIVGAPQMMAALVRHPSAGAHTLESVTFAAAGGAALQPELQDDIARRFPRAVVGQGWGLTELSGACAIPDRALGTKPGSVGPPLPNTCIRVADPESGADVGAGQSGELLVSGPQMMLGYLGKPEETSAMVGADGWLHTGDLGYVGEDGCVCVIDRLKNLIKVNAIQVAPAELEALLLTHPGVADVVVIGQPDERTGEAPVALVVRRSDDVSASALREWLDPQIAYYKRLRDVHFVPAIPRSPSGKVLRAQLYESFLKA